MVRTYSTVFTQESELAAPLCTECAPHLKSWDLNLPGQALWEYPQQCSAHSNPLALIIQNTWSPFPNSFFSYLPSQQRKTLTVAASLKHARRYDSAKSPDFVGGEQLHSKTQKDRTDSFMQFWSGYFSLRRMNRMWHWKGEENHLHLPFTCIFTPTDTGCEDEEAEDWGEELFIKQKETGFQREEEKG